MRADEALDWSNPHDRSLYVEGLHGESRPLNRLSRDIRRTRGGGVWFFTGQPGSGKSTELLRLRQELSDKGSKTYYCDLQDWLNLNEPVTLSSFLVALLASWVDQVKLPSTVSTPGQRLIDFFTKTGLDLTTLQLSADAGLLKTQMQWAMQTDANFRQKLEKSLRLNVSSFIAQAQVFVSELKADLCPDGQDCIVLADSVEKIRGFGERENAVYASLQQLFVSEGRALSFPGVHMVYSVSAFLLEQNHDLIRETGLVVNMPSVHVLKRPVQGASCDDDAGGLAAMQRLLAQRFPAWEQVFVPDQVRRMAQGSGGDLRDFLRIVRIALGTDIDSLPVADTAIKEAMDDVTPPRVLLNEHIQWMARLDTSHVAELSGPIDALVLQHYLETKHVQAYLNGETWYAVHPLLRTWIHERAKALAIRQAATGAKEV